MQTKKETFINLANELVIAGFSYVNAIEAVAQISPNFMQIVDGNLFSEQSHEIYCELRRRQPDAVSRNPNARGE